MGYCLGGEKQSLSHVINQVEIEENTMNEIDMQTIMDLLHDVSIILKSSDKEVWSEKWLSHIEATQQQMLEQYEWEQTK